MRTRLCVFDRLWFTSFRKWLAEAVLSWLTSLTKVELYYLTKLCDNIWYFQLLLASFGVALNPAFCFSFPNQNESLEATLSVTYSACFTVLQVMKSWAGPGSVIDVFLCNYHCFPP